MAKLAEDLIKKIEELYIGGKKYKEIEETTGVKYDTVRRHCAKTEKYAPRNRRYFQPGDKTPMTVYADVVYRFRKLQGSIDQYTIGTEVEIVYKKDHRVHDDPYGTSPACTDIKSGVIIGNNGRIITIYSRERDRCKSITVNEMHCREVRLVIKEGQ